ncbi:SDR family NAD(P)-dependent oxidoreductase [Arthrobacter sp. CG_A4]|uniref:SDR family NAD(P)-dependent oxidoreductase n=1 Tax=Arthrobacter sp. CG_A4 TaxID=3071706 RepID=UPI002DFE1906|nr:NAD(P)-dependent dehydrogenase (short-subunit alcohol dehydrogenase family) [Arthrobacter sp. CG_A4]
MTLPLAGRTALVTGAGNGLGRAMTGHLVEAGARVIMVGRNLHKLAQSRDELGLTEGHCRLESCDVADPSSVDQLALRLRDECVSLLVNNAGVPGPVSDLVDIDPGDWDEVFATNVRGVYLICRAFLPAMMKARSGDIINIASVSGKRPLVGRTPYCASKMAVIGLTTTLAAEAGPYNIRVNSLSPGPVRGPRMERNFRLEAERTGTSCGQAEADFVSRAALGRMVEEEEVGQALVAILQMRGMTAADIDLSAGMVAR